MISDSKASRRACRAGKVVLVKPWVFKVGESTIRSLATANPAIEAANN